MSEVVVCENDIKSDNLKNNSISVFLPEQLIHHWLHLDIII